MIEESKKKKGFERVKVHLRVRPLSEDEVKFSGPETIIDQIDPSRNLISIKKDSEKKNFTFDAVFTHNTNQKELYSKIGFPVVNSVLDGYNGTILAYGQTGTGKTYTMIGGVGMYKGITPRCLKSIFKTALSSATHAYHIKIGYIQLYMEVFQDLIKHNPNSPILIREDIDEGLYLAGVTWTEVQSVQDCMNLLAIGDRNRVSAFTNMNSSSSRSHAMLMAKVEKRFKSTEPESPTKEDQGTDSTLTRSTLYLVDLAGSERVSKTKTIGNRLDEAKNINLSLLALGNVIQALSENKSKYIPFRDSKLTRILEQSLGGNSKTSMVVTIGPSPSNAQESLSSLLFGSRAMKIQNTPQLNVEIDYKSLCSKLQAELDKVNDGKNISNIQYEQLMDENSALKAQVDSLTAEKAQLSSMLEELKKGVDVSTIEGSTVEFAKMKKYYRNKIEKLEMDQKKFTRDVDKLLQEQEEKINMLGSRIEELEFNIKELEADNAKYRKELEQEKADRQAATEENYELRMRFNLDKGFDNESEEVMKIIAKSSTLKPVNSSSILLSNRLIENQKSPDMEDINKYISKLPAISPVNISTGNASPNIRLTGPPTPKNHELQEKVKQYEKITNALEDELIETVEKYKTEIAEHMKNHNEVVRNMKKQLVKLIRAYEKLKDKSEMDKSKLLEALAQKNKELSSMRSGFH